MKDRSYKSYLYFSPQSTDQSSGRSIFIDPNLLVKFAECAEPHTDAGLVIARSMVGKLTSDGPGLNAAKDVRNPKGYFMDFGESASQRIRVYYEIFQDDGGGTNRGAGLYIYDLKKLNRHDPENRPGLYDVEYIQASNGWKASEKTDKKLDHKKVVIGSLRQDGEYKIAHTTRNVAKILQSQKDDYNLYYSPDYLIDNDSQWEAPAQRINTKAGKHELAALLKKSNAWDTKLHENFTTHVFGEGAKVFLEALEIVKRDGVQLTNHTFKFYSPSASLAQLKRAVNGSGGKLGEGWDKTKPNAISMLYQETDAKNIESMYMDQSFEAMQATRKRTDGLLAKYNTRTDVLNSPNATFVDLWKANQ
jgi:hypothetical protein